jgi:hypothetical protein
MRLGKWDDGYVLDTDSRREDPLYYYVRGEDWKAAIGFEVNPLWKEAKADSVTIHVFREHEPRESEMSPLDRLTMYRRVILALLGRFPGWTRVCLNSAYLREILGDGSLPAAFHDAGFVTLEQPEPRQHIWSRA